MCQCRVKSLPDQFYNLHNVFAGSCFLFHLTGFLLQETSLELVAVGDDGVLQSICEQDMFGIIKDIGVLQWHSRHVGLIPQVLLLLTTVRNLCNVLLYTTCPSLIVFRSE